MPTTVARPRSRAQIQESVRFIKRQLHFTGLNFPIVEFIENVLPQIDKDFQYEYCDKNDLPPNVYAYYSPVENLMKIREDVYIGASKDNPRDRFTLAHEVGHYFLHNEVILTRKSRSQILAYENPEWQANVFAGELLIPSMQIVDMSISEIMKECVVSYSAAEIAHNNAKKSNY